MKQHLAILALLLSCALVGAPPLQAAPEDDFESLSFDDAPLDESFEHPDWFKLSFLNLREDLEEAVQDGKRGIIVYFGQKHCPYCKKLMTVNFAKSDIATYTRTHFDFIATDIWGDRTVTDFTGAQMTEKEFAERQQATFTPTLLFFDADGREALRLRGYYPPYRFRAALEYVADGHYRKETFREYLERAEPLPRFEPDDLNEQPFFIPPPYVLDRSRIAGQRPLAVFFEQGDCHACDVLHSGPLKNEVITGQFAMLDAVQLDMWSDTRVVTPAGQRTTARRWADELGLFYAPTLIFFDRHGKEIIRVDSVVNFYRLRSVLDYVLSGAHQRGLSFQRWRQNPMPRTDQ
ncbi:thioredoxin family protein [Sulfurivermis fontis]|uniref:thioredoxin family protein n=1 Tax=Sulfurivermis fontis TaxID=1972068 RepID=UPI001E371589|nr:thioredoxin fold domain-containing protein [Sulfurivermis fontis]